MAQVTTLLSSFDNPIIPHKPTQNRTPFNYPTTRFTNNTERLVFMVSQDQSALETSPIVHSIYRRKTIMLEIEQGFFSCSLSDRPNNGRIVPQNNPAIISLR